MLTSCCSQHFQGLRRAQNKAESNGVGGGDGPKKADPTLNPITRRPGPGRGRPRKQPAAGASGAPGAAPVTPGAIGAPGGPAAPAVLGMPPALDGVPGVGDISTLSESPGVQDGSVEPQHQPPVDRSVSVQGDTPVDDELAVDPSLEDAEEAEDDDDEHAAKRPRLDDNQDQSLEDVAVLHALAAHNNPVAGDEYEPE